MAKQLFIGGHRGLGCTDHDFYQSRRDIAALPVENTLDSIAGAYRAGCDYVECDAVMSADGVVFTLHNVVPADHFFAAEKPAGLLNALSFDDIARYRTGRGGQGRVAPLAEVLRLIAGVDPKTLPFAVNIEIKGVQGSNQPYETNDYLARLADTVRQSPLEQERILFSSFALHNITAMSHLLPKARYGMLFAEPQDGEARPIYADHRDEFAYQYLPYTDAACHRAMQLWREDADPAARLTYFHPEFTTLSPDSILYADKHNTGINCWALFEEMTPARRAAYDRMAEACAAEDVPFTAITDYVEAFRR